MKHTPGPWSYWNGICSPGGRVTQDETGTHIAIPTVYANAQLTDANARLIAAAPDLLSALEDFLDMAQEPPEANCSCHISPPCGDCVDNHGLREAFRNARAAIAKATGKEMAE
jgi:hypothetical protein